ncbi:hypothetical protein AWENTII_012510 [Aspergillus wentii]
MPLNVQASEEGCWESSPCMEMHDPCSLEPLVHPPSKTPSSFTKTFSETFCIEFMGREAEHTGRPENHFPQSVSANEFPSGWQLSTNQGVTTPPMDGTEFVNVDLNAWYPHYTACLQHFLDHAQHSAPVQAVAAFINIRLPYQRPTDPVWRFSGAQPVDSTSVIGAAPTSSAYVSLRPYLRRLIVTGQDTPTVLHAFFGGDWVTGIGCICKQERVNYLFTAKSSGWAATKSTYDILPDQQTPCLRPLREPSEEELRSAETRWSEWLAMEDWMVGPRSPW